ncbi:MAG: glycosyltransferase family 4 protein [bacterium]
MKIAVVTDYYRPGNSRVQEQHVRHLAKLGHEVHLLGGTEEPQTARERYEFAENTHYHPFQYRPTQSKWKQFNTLGRELRSRWNQLSSRVQPDFVIFNQPLSAFIVQQSSTRNLPSLYVHHAPWHEEWLAHNPPPQQVLLNVLNLPGRFLNTWVRYLVEWWVLGHCDRVVVLSQFMRQKLRTNHPGISRNHIQVIPGGVDANRFHPPEHRSDAREHTRFEENDTVILSVRRLVPRMGLDRLIKSFGRLLENTRNSNRLQLCIVGKGPEKPRLQTLAENVAPGQVYFEGYVSEEQLPYYYQSADLFVMPTQELEGFGLVILEALSSGVPVLATDVGGIPEILKPLDPNLLLSADSSQWHETIETTLETKCRNPDDSHRCRQYAVNQFSWESGVDKILNIARGML